MVFDWTTATTDKTTELSLTSIEESAGSITKCPPIVIHGRNLRHTFVFRLYQPSQSRKFGGGGAELWKLHASDNTQPSSAT